MTELREPLGARAVAHAPARTSGRLTTTTRLSASERLAFAGHRLRIGCCGVVHDVAWDEMADGRLVAVPRCGTAWGGAEGKRYPTARPVGCLKCRRAAGEPVDRGHPPQQPALW